MKRRIKILVIGPCESGKSYFSNFVADIEQSDFYKPTQAVRILEMEKKVKKQADETAIIEIWDISGDKRFQNTWEAIKKDTNGCIFIFNPDDPRSDSEMSSWITSFPQPCKIPPSQCMAFANIKSGEAYGKLKPPRGMENLEIIQTNMKDFNELKVPFEKFYNKLYDIVVERESKFEENIMDN